MKKHLQICGVGKDWGKDQVEKLGSTSRGEQFLLTLEALWIKELSPSINTKEEWKSRELTIKL